MKPLLLLPLLPMLLVILLTLPSCTTIAVHSDGSCDIETPRKVVAKCGESTIATGEVLMDGQTVTSVAKQVGEVIK